MRYRRYLAERLSAGCVDCGTRDIRVLEFDHVQGVKVASVSRLVLDSSLQKVIEEVDKCEVRCSNCHTLVTYARRGGSWRDLYASAGYITEVYDSVVPHNEILESLLVTSNRLIRIAAQATGNTTPSAVWRTLSILDNLGPMRVGELAAASRISQPGITRLLPAMIDEGLVSRSIDREDSRALVIGLTGLGRERLVAWRRELSTTLEPLFADLEPREWQTLERAAAILASRTAVGVGEAA